MIGFLQSLMIKDVPSLSMNKAMSNTSNGEVWQEIAYEANKKKTMYIL